MINPVTTSIILDTRRAKKNGLYPVKLRLIYERVAKYFPLNVDLSEDDWEKVNSQKPRKEHKELRLKLNHIENTANKIIDELPVFSFTAFESRFTNKPSEKYSLYTLFKYQIERLRIEGRAGTASSYENALSSLKKFDSSLNFEDVTPELLTQYEKWMIGNGKSLTTVGMYLRSLRVIFNEAIEVGYIKKSLYPFGKRKYKIPAGRNVKKALTLAEVEKIFKYDAAPGWEEKAKDFWVFSYLANGINIKDIARLKYKHIGEDYITFIRAKTEYTRKQQQKPIVAPVTPEVRRIIDRWGNEPHAPNNFVFPILEEGVSPERELAVVRQFTKMINTYIKRIAKAVGIEKNVSTYTARHSFSTVLKRSGAPIEYISEALGHQDLRTTENYLDSFEDDVKKRYASVLTNFSSNRDAEQVDSKDIVTAATTAQDQ